MNFFKLSIPSFVFVAAIVGHSWAYTIDDNYIGGKPTHNYNNADVIGDYKYYDIDGMNVVTSGKTMKVDIVTSFVYQTKTSTIWSEQTHIGDLFLGTGGWKPYGSSKYGSDTASNSSTIWDFVAVFDNHVPVSSGDTTKGGAIKVYSTKDGSFVKSNLGTLNYNNWIYRDDQYVQFTPTANAIALATGSWSIADGFSRNGIDYGDLSLNFDYSKIDAESNEWAFHWAMTCGNDVIEGQTHVPPVPEPSTLVLLSAGLFGFGILIKRKSL